MESQGYEASDRICPHEHTYTTTNHFSKETAAGGNTISGVLTHSSTVIKEQKQSQSYRSLIWAEGLR